MNPKHNFVYNLVKQDKVRIWRGISAPHLADLLSAHEQFCRAVGADALNNETNWVMGMADNYEFCAKL